MTSRKAAAPYRDAGRILTDLTDRLDEIEARADAATPGAWEAWDRGIGFEVHVNGEGLNSEFRETFRQADAEFIAAARTDVPQLVAALRAVLEPAPVKDLYFVSRNDGSHEFSETLAAHERAVDRYQRRRPRAGS